LWSASSPPEFINPQNYPQSDPTHAVSRFNLCRAAGGLFSLSDRSRVVLPDAGIAKVGSAWVATRYQRCAMWQI
jgi:hypothetical protein